MRISLRMNLHLTPNIYIVLDNIFFPGAFEGNILTKEKLRSGVSKENVYLQSYYFVTPSTPPDEVVHEKVTRFRTLVRCVYRFSSLIFSHALHFINHNFSM